MENLVITRARSKFYRSMVFFDPLQNTEQKVDLKLELFGGFFDPLQNTEQKVDLKFKLCCNMHKLFLTVDAQGIQMHLFRLDISSLNFE